MTLQREQKQQPGNVLADDMWLFRVDANALLIKKKGSTRTAGRSCIEFVPHASMKIAKSP